MKFERNNNMKKGEKTEKNGNGQGKEKGRETEDEEHQRVAAKPAACHIHITPTRIQR